MIDIVYVNVNKGVTYTIDTNQYFYFEAEGSFSTGIDAEGNEVEKVGVEDINKLLVIRKALSDGTSNEVLELTKKKTMTLKLGSALYIINGKVKIDGKEYDEKTWINISSGDVKKTIIPSPTATILLTKNPAHS
jgi:hypothetical protein